MPEPVGITLAALALLDPAIRAVRKAYGIYKLTRLFGEHYVGVQRNLDGEQARLEVALDTDLAYMPKSDVISQINVHLGNLREHFQACQEMIANIDGHTGINQSSIIIPPNVPIDPSVGSFISEPTPAKSNKFWQRIRRKINRSSKQASLHTSSGSTTPQTVLATSENSVSISTLPEGLNGEEARIAAAQQKSASENIQAKATWVIKAKWLSQRKEFMKHLDEIHISNNFIRDIVSMKALAGIHNILLIPVFKGTIPEEVLVVQDSLRRLHTALKGANQQSENQEPVVVSLRIMKAADYIQRKKRLALEHEYVKFRNDSALYPLQIDSSKSTSSTMILAETIMKVPLSSEVADGQAKLDPKTTLSRMLDELNPDAYESFKSIGSITTPTASADTHELYQDISTSWVVQETLVKLIRKTTKYRTYIYLAAQVAISYMYFASIGTSHAFPQLADYHYYNQSEEVDRPLGPENVLEPYLSVGFGSRPLKRSTREVGGTTSHLTSRDEVMTSLGLVLHQIGCWTVFEEDETTLAIRAAKAQREDLVCSAAMPYTLIVDLCLAAKEGEWEPQERANDIYRKVVAPLQRIIDDLR